MLEEEKFCGEILIEHEKCTYCINVYITQQSDAMQVLDLQSANAKSRCKTCELSFHNVTVCAMLQKAQVLS